MASTVFPAASAAGKTAFRTTLTSGTSYTVPTGVTYLNVTLYGGGSGGAVSGGTDISTNPGSGGTTTFTGATSASGGTAPTNFTNNSSSATLSIPGCTPGAETANTGLGGKGNGASTNTSASAMVAQGNGGNGNNGQIVSSTLSATAGNSIAYAIGAGGSRGTISSSGGGSTCAGGAGGSGRIDVEYWA